MSGMLQKSDNSYALLFVIFIFNAGTDNEDTPLLTSAGGATKNFEDQHQQDDNNGMTRELLLYGYLNFLLYRMFSASEV